MKGKGDRLVFEIQLVFLVYLVDLVYLVSLVGSVCLVSLVYLVNLVYLVDIVSLVYLVDFIILVRLLNQFRCYSYDKVGSPHGFSGIVNRVFLCWDEVDVAVERKLPFFPEPF